MKFSVVEGFRLTEIAAWAQLHLESGHASRSPMGWPAFNGVTAAGCVHEPMVTGVAEKPRSSVPSFVG